MGHLVISIAGSLLVVTSVNNSAILYLALLYSCLRVFEIVVYQINVMLFHPYRAKVKKIKYVSKAPPTLDNRVMYRIKSPLRMIILLIHNYLELIFWYVIMTVSLLKLSGNENILSWRQYVESSFYCIATFNTEMLKDICIHNHSIFSRIAFIEIISGLIMTIISLAKFIGVLPNGVIEK